MPLATIRRTRAVDVALAGVGAGLSYMGVDSADALCFILSIVWGYCSTKLPESLYRSALPEPNAEDVIASARNHPNSGSRDNAEMASDNAKTETSPCDSDLLQRRLAAQLTFRQRLSLMVVLASPLIQYFGLQYLCTVAAMSSPTREAGQLMAVVQPSLFAMLSCIRLGLVLVEHSTESNAALQAAIHFPQRQLEAVQDEMRGCAEDVSRSLMAVERLEGELRGLKNHLQRSIGVVSHVHTNELEVEDRVIELSRRLDDLQRHVSQATTPPPPITLWSLLRFESPLRKARNLLLALLKEDFADRDDVRRMVRRVAPQVSS